jgi:hypothetical protein
MHEVAPENRDGDQEMQRMVTRNRFRITARSTEDKEQLILLPEAPHWLNPWAAYYLALLNPKHANQNTD